MPPSRSALPASGKNTSIQWTVNGRPVAQSSKIERFSVKTDKTQITAKYIGQSGSQIVEEFDGHSGSFTAVVDGRELNEIEDASNASIIAGTVNSDLGLNITSVYADGTSESHAYPNVVLQMEVTGARGETTKAAFTWMTGSNRIPLT